MGATAPTDAGAVSPMTGRELRAQLRAQHPRNGGATGNTHAEVELRPVAVTDAATAPPITAGTHFRWCVVMRGREPFEVRVLPESTAAEMQAQYPGAKVEPIREDTP